MATMINEEYNATAEKRIAEVVGGKKVLFISIHKKEYIRNTQETALLKKHASEVKELAYQSKGYFKRLFKIGVYLLTHSVKAYDVVFVGYVPQAILPFLSWKFKHATIITDFFISFYDTYVCDRTYFKKGSFMAKRMHRLDEKSIAKSDYIIADTKTHANYFKEEFSVGEKPLIVYYLSADKEIYNENVEPYTKKGKFEVLYFGMMNPLQGLKYVLESARLLESKKDISYTVIGPVSDALKREYSALSNTEFIEWLPQSELASRIAGCDLCLAGHFDPNIMKAKRTIPGKTYIYRAVGKPVVLGESDANRELFDESMEGVYFVPQGDARKLADTVLAAKNDMEKGKN